MLPKDQVRSLRLRRVVVPIGHALHAQIEQKCTDQRIFGSGRDAAPLGLEISSKAVAPIAAHEELIWITGIKPIAPHALIFPDERHDTVFVELIVARAQDLILPAEHADADDQG